MWPRSGVRPLTDAPPDTMAIDGASGPGKRVEEVFGWVKTVAGGRKLRYCGVERNRL